VTCPPDQYANTLRLAWERVSLRELGILELRPRRAKTGALLLEIAGANRATKTEALAGELREALKNREGVIVTRPIKTAEIRVKDIMDSISAVEVAEAVAEQGKCSVAEIRVGPVRLGTAWVRCPLVAANRLARRGPLTLAGWSRARIESLPERPVTCFRCLRAGHVRAACPGGEDRSDACYSCGTSGHLARDCGAPPQVPPLYGDRPPGQPQGGRWGMPGPQEGGKKKGAPQLMAPTKGVACGGETRTRSRWRWWRRILQWRDRGRRPPPSATASSPRSHAPSRWSGKTLKRRGRGGEGSCPGPRNPGG